MKDRPSILVVDDDPNISRLEQLYLEKENFEVRVADRGDTALEEFRRMPPDLILLDVMLPGMDGYQVLKAVRKSGNIPVIMVTARGETFDKVLCLELGADDYITKPFDGKELTARIKAVLRRAQGSDEEKNTDVTFPGLTVSISEYDVRYGKRSRCRRRNWKYCTSWLPIRTRCSRGSSCCPRYGDSISSGTAGRWTCTSSGCGKSCRRAKSTDGRCTRCGAWDISSVCKE